MQAPPPSVPPGWGYGPPPYAGYAPPVGYVLVAPPPVPRPRGIPSRTPFVVGAVGHFFSAAMSIAYGVGSLLLIGLGYLYRANPLVVVILAGVLFAALVLHVVGFLGLWKNYGSGVGAGAFAYGLIAATMFLVANILSLFAVEQYCTGGYYPYCYERIAPWSTALTLASIVMIGVMFIVDGVAFLATRRFTPIPGAGIAAGVLFIVGGSLVTSIVMATFGGFFVLVPAFIIGGVILLRAPLPATGMRPAAPRL